MKEIIIFLTLTLLTLPALKIIEYFRYIKLNSKHLEQMNLLIEELRAKQKILNERVRIIRSSEEFQKNSVNTIYESIYKTINKLMFFFFFLLLQM